MTAWFARNYFKTINSLIEQAFVGVYIQVMLFSIATQGRMSLNQQAGVLGIGSPVKERWLIFTTWDKNWRSIQRTQKPRFLNACDLWSWHVTFTLRQGRESYVNRCRLLYSTLIPGRYDNCESNCLPDMTISSFLLILDLHLWPGASVKVTFILILSAFCCCILVPSMKLIGSKEFEL